MIFRKLFTRKSKEDDVALHVAGATVRHRTPFESMEVVRNKEQLTKEFIDKWVVPFYLGFFSADDALQESIVRTAGEITPDIVMKLFGDFNWRTRITGAYFAAINQYRELEDTIGIHLMKSEVCYAGGGYCLALASFATEKSIDYLKQYLDYYLEKKDLYFDQGDALAALWYLDKDAASGYQGKWQAFVTDKSNWDLENYKRSFANSMEYIQSLRQRK